LVLFSGNIIGAIRTKTDQLALIELLCLTAAALLIIAWNGVTLGPIPKLVKPSPE